MEKHKCKLCARTFANGRALGGHMKAHLVSIPIPPKPLTVKLQHLCGDHDEEESYTYSSSGGEKESKSPELLEEKSLVYGLRENPKRSFRLADPEFSFAGGGGSVVQDRESETESSKNPTPRRSKRTRKSGFGERHREKQSLEDDDDDDDDDDGDDDDDEDASKKAKFKNPSWTDTSQAEPEPASSVSDISPEEDIAMCLMMLSRDVWIPNNEEENLLSVKGRSVEVLDKSEAIRSNKASRKIRSGKFRCEKCRKLFRSSRALSGHKRICTLNAEEARNAEDRIFQCPYCLKVFGSGQALGGHKRSHLIMGTPPNASTTASDAAAAAAESSAKVENNLFDLNLPAPEEDDEFSVVSDG